MKLLECKLCKLHKKRTQVVLPLIIGTVPLVMFIAEAPGKTEDKSGKPLCGRSGDINNKLIDLIGLKSYILANCVQCRPVDKNGKNGKPKDSQMGKCKVWLDMIYGKYKPKLIVLYGEYALKNMLGFTNISNYVGRFFEHKFAGEDVIFFIMYHPATVLYNKKKYWPIFKRHALLISKFFGGK